MQRTRRAQRKFLTGFASSASSAPSALKLPSPSIRGPVAAEGFGGDAQRSEQGAGFGLVGGGRWFRWEDLGEAALETGAVLVLEFAEAEEAAGSGADVLKTTEEKPLIYANER